MKRRIALLTDGWKRLVNTAWSTGLVQYIKENNVDASVEWFQSWGGASQNTDFIHGEYNIYALPDFAEYDGIVVELVNMVDQIARERILNRVRESGVPAVALCDDIPGMYYVSVRGYEAIREFMYHLYEIHGCRSFHFAGGPRNNYENGQRVMAYQTALRELGLPEYAESVNYGDFDKSSGKEAVELLTKDGGRLPDAILCANDNIAVAAVIAAEKLGYRVPEDVKITGFDNFDKAELFWPQITTAEVRREAIGYRAASMLDEIWQGKDIPRVSYISPKIIYGESCGCPNDGRINYREVLRNQIIAGMDEMDETTMLSAFEAELHGGKDFCEMAETSMKLLEREDQDGYAIVLDRRIHDLSCGAALRVDGYDAEMLDVAGVKLDGKRLRLTRPELQDRIRNAPAGTLTMFYPIHIEQYVAGFVVMFNPRFLIKRQNLFDSMELVLSETANRYANVRLSMALGQLQSIYNKDQLTGAYSRTAYDYVIAPKYRKWSENGGAAVLFMDADSFKELNDRFGHSYGDSVLKRIALRVQQNLPMEGVVCRYGGDEFVAVYPCPSMDEAQALADQIENQLLEENIHVSIGIAVSGTGSIESETGSEIVPGTNERTKRLDDAVKEADEKMYLVKQKRHHR